MWIFWYKNELYHVGFYSQLDRIYLSMYSFNTIKEAEDKVNYLNGGTVVSISEVPL